MSEIEAWNNALDAAAKLAETRWPGFEIGAAIKALKRGVCRHGDTTKTVNRTASFGTVEIVTCTNCGSIINLGVVGP